MSIQGQPLTAAMTNRCSESSSQNASRIYIKMLCFSKVTGYELANVLKMKIFTGFCQRF